MIAYFALFFASFFIYFTPVQAQDAKIITAFETYFNELDTFKASFIQEDGAENAPQTGVFHLKRPKQFNWTYTAPTPQRIISTGSRLFYIDDTSEQITQLPLNIGLAAVLTQETLDLSHESLNVLNTVEDETSYQIVIEPKHSGAADGISINANVTLVLNKNPRQLTQMITTNPLGQRTVVKFTDVVQGETLNANLFNFTPPSEDIGAQFRN